jgi:hypothetical protein
MEDLWLASFPNPEYPSLYDDCKTSTGENNWGYPYLGRRYHLCGCFQGVRYPNGRPTGLHELHCDLFDG